LYVHRHSRENLLIAFHVKSLPLFVVTVSRAQTL